ncbi:transmembrane 9 superfamily member 1, partial [Homo sapiens]
MTVVGNPRSWSCQWLPILILLLGTALVQVYCHPHDCWRLPAFQCHLCGAVLHLCHSMGSGAVHFVRHPLLCLRHPAECGGLHLHCTHLLPVVWGGLPLVVAICAECWLHRPLHLPLLSFLLCPALQHVWGSTD